MNLVSDFGQCLRGWQEVEEIRCIALIHHIIQYIIPGGGACHVGLCIVLRANRVHSVPA
jgi:hypothetical protein